MSIDINHRCPSCNGPVVITLLRDDGQVRSQIVSEGHEASCPHPDILAALQVRQERKAGA